MNAEEERDDARLELTEIGLGVTVLGVIVNMGLTLGLGVSGPLGLKLGLAFGCPVLFAIVVALGSRRFHLTRSITRAVTQHGDDPWTSLIGSSDDDAT
jgi:hypothetical protein